MITAGDAIAAEHTGTLFHADVIDAVFEGDDDLREAEFGDRSQDFQSRQAAERLLDRPTLKLPSPSGLRHRVYIAAFRWFESGREYASVA